MLWNLNVDCENKKLSTNAHNAYREEICYEILEYSSKVLQIKTSTFAPFLLSACDEFSKNIAHIWFEQIYLKK